MIAVDWSLIIGYSLEDALDYIKDEGDAYQIKVTYPPTKRASSTDKLDQLENLRVISIRNQEDFIELICAEMDWTVS